MEDGFLLDNESKAAKLFAARRLRSEKYSQGGWGTCSEIGSETECISDESEDELCFSDSEVPDYIEPTIRSATPSAPSQMLETGGGRGSRLFTARKSRMENYTRSGMGKTTGLPTGKLNDRQRCGYAAKTKYDLAPDLDDFTGNGEKSTKLFSLADEQKKDPNFIDMTMPPPKKIHLPPLVIEKPGGPLPFQYLRPSQYNGVNGDLVDTQNGNGIEMDSESTVSSFKPWANQQNQFKPVKPPVSGMTVKKIKPVIDKPKRSSEFGSQINDIATRNFQPIKFSGKKNKVQGDMNAIHSKNMTATGFKQAQMSQIQSNARRMSLKDLIVNGTPYIPEKTPVPIEDPLKPNMHDTQIDNFMIWNKSKEDRCPTRAQRLPPMKTGITPISLFQPKKFSANSASAWSPRS